jgi:hypothetical protein
LVLFFRKDQKILLFLKKKKQKDFYPLAARRPRIRHPARMSAARRSSWNRTRTKSLFASFSEEKEAKRLLFLRGFSIRPAAASARVAE